MNLELSKNGEFSSPAPFLQVDDGQNLDRLRRNQRSFLLDQRRKGEAFTIDRYVNVMIGLSLDNSPVSRQVNPITVSKNTFYGLPVLLPDGMKREGYVLSPDVNAIKREQDDNGQIGRSNVERRRLTSGFFSRLLAKVSTDEIKFPFYNVGKDALQYSFIINGLEWGGMVKILDDDIYRVRLSEETQGLEVGLEVEEGKICSTEIRRDTKVRLHSDFPYNVDFSLEFFGSNPWGFVCVAGLGFKFQNMDVYCTSVNFPGGNTIDCPVPAERAEILRTLENAYIDLEATLENLAQPKTEPVKLFASDARIDLGPLSLYKRNLPKMYLNRNIR